MWVFTKSGFVSCVKHRDKPDTILVRARLREQLEAFIGPNNAANIYEDDRADYPIRVDLGLVEFKYLLLEQVDAIDYPNFKSSIPHTDEGRRYCSACHNVWFAMRKMQDDANGNNYRVYDLFSQRVPPHELDDAEQQAERDWADYWNSDPQLNDNNDGNE